MLARILPRQIWARARKRFVRQLPPETMRRVPRIARAAASERSERASRPERAWRSSERESESGGPAGRSPPVRLDTPAADRYRVATRAHPSLVERLSDVPSVLSAWFAA